MEPEVQKSDFADAPTVETSTVAGGSLAPASAEAGSPEYQELLEQVYSFLSNIPEFIGKIYGEYRQPIVTVGLIIVALVSVKLLLAILGAINEVPLLAPTFELVGMGYSGWFIYRYLLRASSRQELGSEFNTLKDQVLGQK